MANSLPILIVEEGASENERITWLDSGADDILTFTTSAPAELSARCHALLRRTQRQLRRGTTRLICNLDAGTGAARVAWLRASEADRGASGARATRPRARGPAWWR